MRRRQCGGSRAGIPSRRDSLVSQLHKVTTHPVLGGLVLTFFGLALERCIPVNTAPRPQYVEYAPAQLQPAAPAPVQRPFCGRFVSSTRQLALVVTCEDFSTVADGTLPAGWRGGESLVAGGQAGQRRLVPFEPRDVHRIIASGFHAQGDYRLDVGLRLGSWNDGAAERRYRLRVGSVAVMLQTAANIPSQLSMNQSQADNLPDLTGQLVVLSLRREGSVHRLLLDGRQILLARYEQTAPVDGVTLEFEGLNTFGLLGLRLESEASATPAAALSTAGTVVAPDVAPSSSPATPTPPASAPPPQVEAVAVGRDLVCALMTDHVVRCHMRPDRPADRIDGLGETVRIVARDRAVCATNAAGQHRCWGQLEWNGEGDAPDAGVTPQFLDITGGEVVAPVEGMNGTGNSPLVVSGGTARSVGIGGAAGGFGPDVGFDRPVLHADQGPWSICAVFADHTVGCRSWDQHRPTVPVDGITNAVDLRLGRGHGCALLEGGQVRCWATCSYGEGDEVGSPACRVLERPRARSRLRAQPVRLGPARALAAFSGGSCAALVDGSVQCWRMESRGPTAPQVIAGFDHVQSIASDGAGEGNVCALQEGGVVQCWASSNAQAARRLVTF